VVEKLQIAGAWRLRRLAGEGRRCGLRSLRRGEPEAAHQRGKEVRARLADAGRRQRKGVGGGREKEEARERR
jgi:hypothetical protein